MSYYQGFRVKRAGELGKWGSNWAGGRLYPSERTGWSVSMSRNGKHNQWTVKTWRTVNPSDDMAKDDTLTTVTTHYRYETALDAWMIAVDSCIAWMQGLRKGEK